MESLINIRFYLMYLFVNLGSSWQYYTQLTDLTLTASEADPMVTHSEYIFGECKRHDLRLYAHVHLNHIDILGKPIVRGWLKINRIPLCIRLVARAYKEDTFRSTGYPFQICVPRLRYCHSESIWIYYYYEWYIPNDMQGGMNWDIYFLGPGSTDWWIFIPAPDV